MYIRLKVESFKMKMLMNGFTQRSLAVEANISDTTVNHIINGHRHPGPTTAKKICNAMKCSFDDIFFIDNDSKSYHSNTA